MDYYGSSSRSSYRGSSYRGSSNSYRGSRGSYRGSRGRGTGSSTYYSPKYSSTEGSSKYSSSASRYDDYARRPESSYSARDDLSAIASRKRVRTDDYSQGSYTRREEKYSSSSYDTAKKPRADYKEYRPERAVRKTEYSTYNAYRIKEPLRVRPSRPTRGRGIIRRGRGSSTYRPSTSSGTAAATTSEILAIRRAKLLQKRMAESAGAAGKDEKKADESGELDESGTEKISGETGATPKKTADTDEERTNFYGKPFMKLQCPACNLKAITFKEYIAHLHSPVHVKAIKEKSDELKKSLAAMRIEQREVQKIADEEDLTSMNTRPHFCHICKLNFSQESATHNASELHKKLRAFLLPYCRPCRLPFQSPMPYETHLCSLDHLRQKHRVEEREKEQASSGILDKFMVLDSVEGGDDVDEKEEVEAVAAKAEGEEETEEDLNLGLEFIHDVKRKYCEVCRVFLPRSKDIVATMKRHCRTKDHLRNYLHFGNEALLEKIQEESKGTDKKDGDGDETVDEEKLWSDVGELLNETQTAPKSDDEDEEEGGRFDRFKTNEKKENGEIKMETEEVGEEVEESPVALSVPGEESVA